MVLYFLLTNSIVAQMKQYRLRLLHKNKTEWTEWRDITIPIEDKDILKIEFNEPLTLEESREFFKHYEVV